MTSHFHNQPRMIRRLRSLYEGQTGPAIRFQVVLALVDIGIIVIFLLQPYLADKVAYIWLDYTIALWIGADLAVQFLIARNRRRWLLTPLTWADFIIFATLLWPNLLFNFAFLRAMRLWAIARRPLLKAVLRKVHSASLLDVVRAAVNLTVFLFMASGFVYTFFFFEKRQGTEGFVDALYFTVTTMTTTGFGDITLPGTAGKLTSIVMMIVGISLFVRLAQALVRPFKVTFPCPKCGLSRHDADAVHCKACGQLLNIPDEGQ